MQFDCKKEKEILGFHFASKRQLKSRLSLLSVIFNETCPHLDALKKELLRYDKKLAKLLPRVPETNIVIVKDEWKM